MNPYKRIREVSFIFLVKFLSYFIKPNKNNIAFSSNGGNKVDGNPFYFLQYYKKNKPSKNYYWITKDDRDYNVLKGSMNIIYMYSWEGIIKTLTAGLFILSSYDAIFYSICNKNRQIIQTWHGIGVKNTGDNLNDGVKKSLKEKIMDYLKKISKQEYVNILVTSDSLKKNFEIGYPRSKVYVTGYPRFDYLLNSENEFFKNGFNRTILFAPTWRIEGDFELISKRGLDRINSELKSRNEVLYIKYHPKMKRVFDLIDYTNIRDMTDCNMGCEDILLKSDVLITDYSSILFDYMLLDKDYIIYCPDYDDYIKTEGTYYEYSEKNFYPFTRNEKELIAYLFDIEPDKDLWKKMHEKNKNFFNKYLDGKSSERIYELIEKIM